jgi:hypothetical protein
LVLKIQNSYTLTSRNKGALLRHCNQNMAKNMNNKNNTKNTGLARSKLPEQFRSIGNHAGLCDGNPMSFDAYAVLYEVNTSQLRIATAGADNSLDVIKERMGFGQRLTSYGVLLQLCCLYDALCVCNEREFDKLWDLFSLKSMFYRKHRHQVALFHARLSLEYLNNIRFIVHNPNEFAAHVQGTLWWTYQHMQSFCSLKVNSILDMKDAVCVSSREAITSRHGPIKVACFVKALRSTGVPLAITDKTLNCTADIEKVAKYYKFIFFM